MIKYYEVVLSYRRSPTEVEKLFVAESDFKKFKYKITYGDEDKELHEILVILSDGLEYSLVKCYDNKIACENFVRQYS